MLLYWNCGSMLWVCSTSFYIWCKLLLWCLSCPLWGRPCRWHNLCRKACLPGISRLNSTLSLAHLLILILTDWKAALRQWITIGRWLSVPDGPNLVVSYSIYSAPLRFSAPCRSQFRGTTLKQRVVYRVRHNYNITDGSRLVRKNICRHRCEIILRKARLQ